MSSIQPTHQLAETVFNDALQRFKQKYCRGLKEDHFNFTKLSDLDATIYEILQRPKSWNIRERLAGFLEGVEQYEKLVEIFLNASGILAFVWVSFPSTGYALWFKENTKRFIIYVCMLILT